MTSGVGINSEKEIKLVKVRFDDTIQISRLKSTIKNDLFFQVESGIHAFEGPVENRISIMIIGSQALLNYRNITLIKEDCTILLRLMPYLFISWG